MQNLRLRGRPPPIIFARIVRPMNAFTTLSLTVFTERNLLGATSENRSKIGNFTPTRSLWPKISGRRGSPPPIIFAWIVRPMNALKLCCWHFSHKETCGRLSSSEVQFWRKNGHFAFLSPLWGLRGNVYDDHLRLIGMRIVDFLLVLIELFYARCYGWGAMSDYLFKIGNFAPTGIGWPKISGRWGRPPPNILFLRKLG